VGALTFAKDRAGAVRDFVSRPRETLR
jgi:hypothetical protein